MAYGNEAGLAIVDIVQKVCLFNVASPDLYGAQDPYSRVPRSPKRSEPPYSRDEQRSPSIDQVSASRVEIDDACLMFVIKIQFFFLRYKQNL